MDVLEQDDAFKAAEVKFLKDKKFEEALPVGYM
jgi:hypothetical protein